MVRKVDFAAFRAALLESRGTARARLSIGAQLLDVRLSGEDLIIGSKLQPRRVGNQNDWEEWLGGFEAAAPTHAFTAARGAVTAQTQARVALGGKMGIIENREDEYQGSMPGVVEESIMTLEASKPLVVLGAFGGAARDMATVLGLAPTDIRVPRGEQAGTYEAAMERLRSLRHQIPDYLRLDFEKLAVEDRSEQLAYEVARLLKLWLARS